MNEDLIKPFMQVIKYKVNGIERCSCIYDLIYESGQFGFRKGYIAGSIITGLSAIAIVCIMVNKKKRGS